MKSTLLPPKALMSRCGGYPSYASSAAIILFAIVLTITCINLLVSRKPAVVTRVKSKVFARYRPRDTVVKASA